MFEELIAKGGISLERLIGFCQFAESGSIARASGGNASKQALISRQIRELETFFEVDLTQRRGKAIELTEHGSALARQVRIYFQGLSDFKATCANAPIEYKIASGSSILDWLLLPCLGGIRQNTKASTFKFFNLRTRDVIRGLKEHTVDFGIVRESAVVKPLNFTRLGTFGYSLFVPKSLRSAAKNIPDLPIATSTGSEFTTTLLKATDEAKCTLNVVYHCDSFIQAAHMVKLDIAAAILPDLAISTMGRIATRIVPDWLTPLKRDLVLAWHDRAIEVRAESQNLLEVLQKQLKHQFNEH